MPRYTYVCEECGKETTVIRTLEKRGEDITCPDCLGIAHYSFGVTIKSVSVIAGGGGGWPMKSRALAVHPTQRKEYSKFAAKHGVPTQFDEQGHPEFTDRGHKKKYAELVGATDFDGGYGDADSSDKSYD